MTGGTTAETRIPAPIRATTTPRPPVGMAGHSLRWLCTGSLIAFLVLLLGLVTADVLYLWQRLGGAQEGRLAAFLEMVVRPQVLAAIRLSLVTSLTSLALVVATAVPIGFALSRYRFRGHTLADTLVDLPILMPPVVIGISLLAFFAVGPGVPLRTALDGLGIDLGGALGIVLCQYLVAVSYCIRSAKAAFDSVDRELEQVARTLGCDDWQVLWRVSLPLARAGLVAGAIMAWARAVGVFGPLMVFVGTGPRVLVMPTTLYLELSVGNIETSVAIALVMLVLAGTALAVVHRLAPGGVVR